MRKKSFLILILSSQMAFLCSCSYIGRGIREYREEKYMRAMERWRNLEKREADLNTTSYIRYLIYRGLTHYKLKQRENAYKYLTKGIAEYKKNDSKGLPYEAVYETENAIRELRGNTGEAKAEVDQKEQEEDSGAYTDVDTSTPVIPRERAKAGKNVIIAVFPVEDASKRFKKRTLSQLTDYLSARITELGGYQVIPQRMVRTRLVKEKKRGYGKCFDQSCQIEIGKALAAQKVLWTKIIKVGKNCAMSSTIFDLKKEITEKAASARTRCDKSNLLVGVEKIAEKLSR